MYKEVASRTRRVKSWEQHIPFGAVFGIAEAAEMVKRDLPDGVSRNGFGGQTVAVILVRHCGWQRHENRLYKPLADGSVKAPLPASAGVPGWIPSAPVKGSLAALRDSYNAWADANGYAAASSWILRPLIELEGYRVIARPKNIAIYAKTAVI